MNFIISIAIAFAILIGFLYFVGRLYFESEKAERLINEEFYED